MNQMNSKSIHQMRGETGILWALRGLFTSGRNVTLTPEAGIFESEETAPKVPELLNEPPPVKRRRAEWITSNQTYQIGGQLSDVYVKTSGLRLAVHA
jgi:hypothetical protein